MPQHAHGCDDCVIPLRVGDVAPTGERVELREDPERHPDRAHRETDVEVSGVAIELWKCNPDRGAFCLGLPGTPLPYRRSSPRPAVLKSTKKQAFRDSRTSEVETRAAC